MKRFSYDKPPKFWEYNNQTVEDVGGYFVSPDQNKIPIIAVWENGVPIEDKEYSPVGSEEIIREKEELWTRLNQAYGEAYAKTENLPIDK